ncbi:MAG TPA: anthrone oxygenase family protein [Pyrinomonadaceae bacterium]|jgi:Anthrone oxygenase
MDTTKLGTPLLMLTIVLWGTLLGGIAYSHLVFFPVYLSALPGSAVLVNGPYAMNDGIFWMIIHPLLIISLVATLILNWKSSSRRKLIAISFAVYAIVLLVSLFYFVPELVLFKHSPESTLQATEWLVRGRRWQRLSWLRGAVTYLAFVPLLIALTKPAAESEPLLS